MTVKELNVTSTADREIIITRVFNAPRELVFETWTDPKHIDEWWGPRGFTTTTQAIDIKPGGVWQFVMHGPDGTDYPNRVIYREIIKAERLVYTHDSGEVENDPSAFEVTVTLTEQNGKTSLSMRSLFQSKAECEKVKAFGAVELGNSTLDRFEEQLADHQLVITRVFDAPRDLVWKAWTEPARLAKWWGPKGFVLTVASLDLRPGGIFLYGMRTPAGQEMWGKFVYVEVAAPQRLVLISSFTDAAGNIIRSPMSAAWPLEVMNTMTLAEQDGKTTLTLRGGPYNATAEERKTFEDARANVQMGFKGTFEQLDEYLANA